VRPGATLVPALALATVLGGCAADLGLGGAAEVTSGHLVGSGRLAGQTRLGQPLNESGVLVGAALESRAEQSMGSRFTGGIMLGWGSGPLAVGGSPVGFELYTELGAPLRDPLFRNSDLYTGGAFAFPFRIWEGRKIEELNDRTWILLRRFELVPTLRSRVHLDDLCGENTFVRVDVGIGLSLRLRTFSDLF
jgi:hypothetical protein